MIFWICCEDSEEIGSRLRVVEMDGQLKGSHHIKGMDKLGMSPEERPTDKNVFIS
jgi:hypothetical protein